MRPEPTKGGTPYLRCQRTQYAVHAHSLFCGEIDLRFSARTGLLTVRGELSKFGWKVKAALERCGFANGHKSDTEIIEAHGGHRVFGRKSFARDLSGPDVDRGFIRSCGCGRFSLKMRIDGDSDFARIKV